MNEALLQSIEPLFPRTRHGTKPRFLTNAEATFLAKQCETFLRRVAAVEWASDKLDQLPATLEGGCGVLCVCVCVCNPNPSPPLPCSHDPTLAGGWVCVCVVL